MSLPQADDLFRPTVVPDPEVVEVPGRAAESAPADLRGAPTEEPAAPGEPRPSGRVKHDEKMTVYISSTELLDLEDARLALRRRHGLAADRGRLVRAAVALALADLEARGEDSDLVTLLRQQ